MIKEYLLVSHVSHIPCKYCGQYRLERIRPGLTQCKGCSRSYYEDFPDPTVKSLQTKPEEMEGMNNAGDAS